MTFETFPFPWPPGREPADDPRCGGRRRGRSRPGGEARCVADAQTFEVSETSKVSPKRTLTALYNARAGVARPGAPCAGRSRARRRTGGRRDLTDDEILTRLTDAEPGAGPWLALDESSRRNETRWPS